MMDGAEEIVPLESDSGDLKVPAVPQPEPEAAPTPAPQAARKAVSTRTARQASYRRVPVR
jgi:hypothetical protein